MTALCVAAEFGARHHRGSAEEVGCEIDEYHASAATIYTGTDGQLRVLSEPVEYDRVRFGVGAVDGRGVRKCFVTLAQGASESPSA